MGAKTGHSSDRRQRIVQAAERAFDARGYASTTMEAIAEEAGIAKGSIYNYFQSKHDLFTHVVTEALAGDEARADQLRGQELPPPPANVDAPPPSSMPRGTRIQESWTEKDWRLYLATYYLLIENTDWLIGQLLDGVGVSGLENDTLILFTADHGDQMGAHQLVGKGMFYEESMRVPFVISWKGMIEAGQADHDHLISGVDVLPTLCDYAGVRAPDGLPGRSIRPLLENATGPWRDYVVAETPEGRMIRSGSYKYLAYRRDGNPEFLFDLEADSGETESLAASPTARPALEKNRELLAAWMNKTGGSFERTLRLSEKRRSFNR